VNPGVKTNGKYYRETLLMEELLPDMRNISEYFIFQQDNAPAHRAKEIVSDVRIFETDATIRKFRILIRLTRDLFVLCQPRAAALT